MLAYVKRSDNTFGLEHRPRPELGQDHFIIIRVISCSICETDLRAHRFGSNKISPGRITGHEITGEIVEISNEYKNDFSVGDHIAMAPAIGCGHCRYCKSGKTNMCDTLETIGFEYDGGFAEYMVIPRKVMIMNNVYRLPKDDDYAKYSLCEPLACTINAHTYLIRKLVFTVSMHQHPIKTSKRWNYLRTGKSIWQSTSLDVSRLKISTWPSKELPVVIQ